MTTTPAATTETLAATATPAEKRATTIQHIRSCQTCGCDDPELMASLDDPTLPDEEIEDYAQTAHEYARQQRRQQYLRRNS